MSDKVIVADYHNPEYVQAVVGGLMYMGKIANGPCAQISITVVDEQLVIDDGEKRIIFGAMK